MHTSLYFTKTYSLLLVTLNLKQPNDQKRELLTYKKKWKIHLKECYSISRAFLQKQKSFWRSIELYVSTSPGGDESILWDPILDPRSISWIRVQVWRHRCFSRQSPTHYKMWRNKKLSFDCLLTFKQPQIHTPNVAKNGPIFRKWLKFINCSSLIDLSQTDGRFRPWYLNQTEFEYWCKYQKI